MKFAYFLKLTSLYPNYFHRKLQPLIALHSQSHSQSLTNILKHYSQKERTQQRGHNQDKLDQPRLEFFRANAL